MKVWIHPYRLNRKGFLSHEGALFKFEFADGFTGFSDFHPWPELGEPDLAAQLESIKAGELSLRFQKSLNFAKRDAESKYDHYSLFENLQIPKSHYFVNDISNLSEKDIEDAVQKGFTHFKTKVGANEGAESFVPLSKAFIKNGLKLRLDFNAKKDFSSAVKFFESWEAQVGSLELIDFIEDPVPFDALVWSALRNEWGVRIAIDNEFTRLSDPLQIKDCCDVLVFKPACQWMEEIVKVALSNDLKMVVTTSLDHPIGILGAVLEAGVLQKQNPDLLLVCGLVSHLGFERDQFFEGLGSEGPLWNQFPQYGFGFMEELSRLKWDFFL